jgi:glycosyltransferase involved in cell wall biosynthesis
VPVVARNVAGIEDFLVDGRTGFAISGASPRAAAAAVVRALEHPAARLRSLTRRARQLVERRYAWDRMLDVFDRIYWPRG